MDKRKFMIRAFALTAIVAAILFTIFHIATFKVIEANAFQEITKRIVVSLGVIGILEVFTYIIAPLYYHGSKFDPTSEKYKKLHKDE